MAFQAFLLVCVLLLGAVVGSFLNVCVYRLPFQKSLLWPGSHCPNCLRPIRAYDNVPIFSWWLLGGRCRDCGQKFSPRYMAVEAFTAALFAFVLYLEAPAGAAALARYAYHVVLLALLVVATLIDLDLQIIPDSVTVPGMLIGLVGGTFGPGVQLLAVTAPAPEPPASAAYAVLVVIGWVLWIAAVVAQHPRVYGPTGSAQVMLLACSAVYLALQTAVLVARPMPWPGWPAWLAAHPHGAGFATSLIGFLVGAGLVWIVRVLGSAALGKEAMGFGDVTLMAMIGSFLGWQATVLVFFLAPFFGLIVGLIQWIGRGEHVLPYGPYLSLAALAVLLLWNVLWPMFQQHFALLALIPIPIVAALLLPILALALWRNWSRARAAETHSAA